MPRPPFSSLEALAQAVEALHLSFQSSTEPQRLELAMDAGVILFLEFEDASLRVGFEHGWSAEGTLELATDAGYLETYAMDELVEALAGGEVVAVSVYRHDQLRERFLAHREGLPSALERDARVVTHRALRR